MTAPDPVALVERLEANAAFFLRNAGSERVSIPTAVWLQISETDLKAAALIQSQAATIDRLDADCSAIADQAYEIDAKCQSQAARIAELEVGLRLLEAERLRPNVRLAHLKRAVAVQALLLGEGALEETSLRFVPRRGSEQPVTSLDDLIVKARAWFDSLSPEEKTAHLARQKAGWIAAEMSWGDEGTRTVTPGEGEGQ